ncbi:helix-turn-helix domain-containing protein [Paenibacillus sp. FSL R7-0026]|uniref:helix-turn-helix domain-containing protein n=1 Tax=Paenibacillus sp. FSL R7-0026 TaxID=2921668 RepID=UPI0030F90563
MSGKDFGEFLKVTRKQHGYKTQKQLAEVSGISQTTLSRIEAGTQRPQPETLRVLAEHLRPYTYGELMEKAGYFTGLPFEDRAFVMDMFDESEQYEYDRTVESLIESLAKNEKFNPEALVFLESELDPLFKAEGWTDIEFTPAQLKQLIRELDTNIEYKQLIHKALNRVVQLLNSNTKDESQQYVPQTIAAHHDGEDWTEEELEDIEEFKELLKLRRQLRKNKE